MCLWNAKSTPTPPKTKKKTLISNELLRYMRFATRIVLFEILTDRTKRQRKPFTVSGETIPRSLFIVRLSGFLGKKRKWKINRKRPTCMARKEDVPALLKVKHNKTKTNLLKVIYGVAVFITKIFFRGTDLLFCGDKDPPSCLRRTDLIAPFTKQNSQTREKVNFADWKDWAVEEKVYYCGYFPEKLDVFLHITKPVEYR